jgi:phosphoglycolate phosphatase
MMLPAILFDLDGVLIDSRAPFAASVNVALAANGLPARSEAELHRFLGPPIHATFTELTGPDAPAALVQACVDAYREHYRGIAPQTPVFAGMRETLETLAAQRPLAVATSKPHPVAEPLLAQLGLRPLFQVVEGPSLDEHLEPKDVTVARVLEQLDGAEMVGDRATDMMAARAHGLLGIGALWGIGSEAELREGGAHVLAERPADVIALVAEAA